MYTSDTVTGSDGISCLFPCSNVVVEQKPWDKEWQRHPTFPELVYVNRKRNIWKMDKHGRTMAAFRFRGKPIQQEIDPWRHPLQDSTQSESRWPGCAERILKWTWHPQIPSLPDFLGGWGRAKHDSTMHLFILWCLQAWNTFWYLLTSFVRSSNWEGNEKASGIKRDCEDSIQFGVSPAACKHASGTQ